MLKNIKKILVPMDGSKNSFRALEQAIYLARQFGAMITGLYVVPAFIVSEGPKTLGPYRQQLLDQGKKFMEEAKLLSAKNGVVFTGKTALGGVVTSDIIDFASEIKPDLIVISSRGLGRIKELFLGSVSYGVVHKSKIPVPVVK